MLTWLVMGGLLAALVFSLAVVAVPMMLDRQTDVVTAMATSLRATLANPLPLLVWAAVIVTRRLRGRQMGDSLRSVNAWTGRNFGTLVKGSRLGLGVGHAVSGDLRQP